MWQIKFPYSGKVSEAQLKAEVLPIGYCAEKDRVTERFLIHRDDNGRLAGICEKADGNNLLFKFWEDETEGYVFAIAFGLRYPEYNPKQMFFAFAYQTPSGYFQLDKLPVKTKFELADEIRHYAKADDAYLVSFYRGDWQPDENYLRALSMRKIFPDGTLGFDDGPKELTLGDIENEKTM